MKKLGLTGGIGSGKSFIAKILEKMGYPVFYSDQVAKNIMNQNVEIQNQLIEQFGNEVYQDNIINKEFLSTLVFQNPKSREKINQIVHPKVRLEFNAFSKHQKSNLVFNESALVFETEFYKELDANILVIAPLTDRKNRLLSRGEINLQEIENRIQSQWIDDQKIPLADYIITNDGRPVLIQIENIIKKLNNQN